MPLVGLSCWEWAPDFFKSFLSSAKSRPGSAILFARFEKPLGLRAGFVWQFSIKQWIAGNATLFLRSRGVLVRGA